jgi:Fe-S-cluster-containing dehydrogenase component
VAINQPPCAGTAQDRPSDCPVQPASADPKANSLKTTRRDFLRAGGMLSMSSLMGTAALMTQSDNANAATEWAEHFQKNYRLMTPEEKNEARLRLERRYSDEYGKKVAVDTTEAQPGMLMGYALNIRKCIGCRRCVHACVAENNQSRGPRPGEKIEWIQVLRMERGKFEQEKMNQGYPEGLGIQVGGNAYTPAGQVLEGQYHYNPKAVPEADATYMPIACMQCEKPPCVKVCPVRTTYREADGPVVIDYNWCIGCKMCMNACPYWARRFNLTKPVLPKEEMNPVTHYLGKPAAHARRGREVPLVPATQPPQSLPGLRRGLPGRRAQVRQPARSGKRSQQDPGAEERVPPQGRAQHLPEILLLLRLRSGPCNN